MNKEIAQKRFSHALENQQPEFEKFFLAQFFNLSISYGEEECVVEVGVEDYMFNPQGSLHGGVISLIMDVSMGHLCKKFIGTAVTLEMKVQYLKPIKNEKITARGTFLKKGKTVNYTESKIYNQDGVLAAIANATWYKL